MTDNATQSTPKKRPKFADWRPLFLEALRAYGVITYAAELADIDRSTAYKARERNSQFAEEWDDALEQATDALEKEARRRAEEGVRRLKFHQGYPVMVPLLDDVGRPQRDEKGEMIMTPYVEHEYSDTLMIFLLKAHRPQKFRDNLDITSKGEKVAAISYIVENRPQDD